MTLNVTLSMSKQNLIVKTHFPRDTTMAEKKCTSPKMIHISNPSVDYNWWLKRLDTQFNEPTKPTNKNNVFIKLWGLMY